MIILGVDPGSRITGFGLIENHADRIEYLHSGCIRTSGDDLAARLGHIYAEIDAVIGQYRPRHMSIENVFVSRNVDSALKLGQARGVAICAAHRAGLEVNEYAAREIKKAIVGSGSASKEQVQQMVCRLLGIRRKLQADEADGLAIAICHAQFYATQQRTGLDAGLLKRRRNRRR